MAGWIGWSGAWPPTSTTLREAVHVPGRLLDGRDEVVLPQVVRARARDQDAVARQHLHGLLVQLAVGRLPLRDVLAALDEGRRVDDDDVELLAGRPQRRERVERIGAFGTDDVLQSVFRRRSLQQVQRRRRRIDAHDLTRARPGCRESPRAEVAEDVEHARAAHVLEQRPAVVCLVVEPAGLLAVSDRHVESHAVFFDHGFLDGRPAGGLDVTWQAFQFARARVVLPDDRLRRDDLVERFEDCGLHRLHADRADLADDDVTEPVEHQPGQAVGFAVHETVARLRVQPLAQRERDPQPMHEQRLAGSESGIAAEDARADQRVRIDVGVTEEPVITRHDAAQRAGLERRQRRACRVDLVAEDPEVTARDAALFPRLESQFGQVVVGSRGGRGRRGHARFRRRAAAFRYSCRILADRTLSGSAMHAPTAVRPPECPGRRNQPVPAPARGRTPSTGIRGVLPHSNWPAGSTSRSCCRSAIRPVTGATSWRTSPSRIPRPPRS